MVSNNMLNAKDELAKYLKAVDAARRADIERMINKSKSEVDADADERGLTSGDLFLHRLRRILNRVNRLVEGVK
jgi:hypothetical protein